MVWTMKRMNERTKMKQLTGGGNIHWLAKCSKKKKRNEKRRTTTLHVYYLHTICPQNICICYVCAAHLHNMRNDHFIIIFMQELDRSSAKRNVNETKWSFLLFCIVNEWAERASASAILWMKRKKKTQKRQVWVYYVCSTWSHYTTQRNVYYSTYI